MDFWITIDTLIDQSKVNLQGRKIEQADADGAYDTWDAFNKLAENNIKQAIKIRSFSLVKRIMGESVSATKTEHMFHEVGLKSKFANILINA